jgi:predicted site-specific integrase-resolvase
MDDRRRFNMPVRVAADRLGVHPETIKRWARSGKVPARKNFAGHWLLDPQDIDSIPVHEVEDLASA